MRGRYSRVDQILYLRQRCRYGRFAVPLDGNSVPRHPLAHFPPLADLKMLRRDVSILNCKYSTSSRLQIPGHKPNSCFGDISRGDDIYLNFFLECFSHNFHLPPAKTYFHNNTFALENQVKPQKMPSDAPPITTFPKLNFMVLLRYEIFE